MTRTSRDDAQVLMLEMQSSPVASLQTASQDAFRRAATAVVRISEALGLPVLASVVPLGPEPPTLIPELAALSPMVRSTVTPFGDAGQRQRLSSARRRVLAVGGVSSEIAVVNTVLDAVKEGYEVHVLLDCCGGLATRTDAAALRRMELAGAIPTNVSSFFTGMIDDMGAPEGGAVMGALAELWGWNAQAEPTAQAQVDALLKSMRDAWRAGDAARFAEAFTEDARFVPFDGAELKGRDAIQAYHERPFATHLAGTELKLEVQDVSALAHDVLLVSSRGGIVRDGDPEGDLVGLSAQSLVLAHDGAGLLARAFQNTRVRPIDGPKTAEIWKAFDRSWSAHQRSKEAETPRP